MTDAASAVEERAYLAGVVFVVLFAHIPLYPGIGTLVTALGAPAGGLLYGWGPFVPLAAVFVLSGAVEVALAVVAAPAVVRLVSARAGDVAG